MVEESREDVAKEDVAPVVEQPAVVEEPVSPTEEQTVTNASDIVFKVQIMSSDVKMKKTDSRLKGQKDADCYREGRLWKYTVGSSTNYSEIYQLCKQLRKKFPEAFVIAFRDGEKMNIREAIEEFKRTKNS